MPTGRLVRQIADKSQVATQRSWKRPYGVGLLVGGWDKDAGHLYYNCPSGNYYEYKAFAVGARSQVGAPAAQAAHSQDEALTRHPILLKGCMRLVMHPIAAVAICSKGYCCNSACKPDKCQCHPTGCKNVSGASLRVLPQLQPGPAHSACTEVATGSRLHHLFRLLQ